MTVKRVGWFGVLTLTVTAVVFVVSSFGEDRFSHRVTLVGRYDGTVNVREQRDVALTVAETLRADIAVGGVKIDLTSRFNTTLDVEVTASDQQHAATVADSFAEQVVEVTGELGRGHLLGPLLAANAALVETAAELEGLSVETDAERIGAVTAARTWLERDVLYYESQLDGYPAPVVIVSSVGLGRTAPQPHRDAMLALGVMLAAGAIVVGVLSRDDEITRT